MGGPAVGRGSSTSGRVDQCCSGEFLLPRVIGIRHRIDRAAPGLTANDLRRMVCTHAKVSIARLAAGDGVSSFLDQSQCRMHSAARGMEPLTIDRTHILVLNYNGRGLLAECLPSIVAGRRAVAGPCRVTVVDNGSTDGSRRAGRKSLARLSASSASPTSGSPRSTACSSGSTSRSSCS